MVKNPLAKAGDMGSVRCSRKVPHAGEQLSPCSRVWEPQLMSPCAATTEVCMPRVCSLQREKPRHHTRL